MCHPTEAQVSVFPNGPNRQESGRVVGTIQSKVRQCAARVLPDDDIERLIEMVEDLEHASSQDMLALMGLLAQAPASQRARTLGS
jgi:hypothetical protein